MADKKERVQILYTNWRGETTSRTIEPIKIWFGSTQWHKDEQWFITAIDTERNVERDFALKDIKEWS